MKQEVYRVARRHKLRVTLVSNSRLRVPDEKGLELVVVEEGPDEADDWIVEQLSEDDIVVSADIPLASRCLKKSAHVLGPTGKPFTDANIGQALATRDLLSGLRDTGAILGGPPPFRKQDRSRFLQSLEEMVQGIRRRRSRAR